MADTCSSFIGQVPILILILCVVGWKGRFKPALALAEEAVLAGEDVAIESSTSKLRRIDFAGTISLGFAITLLLLILDFGGQKIPWSHPMISILGAFLALLLTVFVVVEGYWSAEPIFPLPFLAKRDVYLPCLTQFLQVAGQFSVS